MARDAREISTAIVISFNDPAHLPAGREELRPLASPRAPSVRSSVSFNGLRRAAEPVGWTLQAESSKLRPQLVAPGTAMMIYGWEANNSRSSAARSVFAGR